MSYAQRKEIGGNRTLAIILGALIQFGLGYAIVTGLAYNVIKKASENPKTFQVGGRPPPPRPPPPPAQGKGGGAAAPGAAPPAGGGEPPPAADDPGRRSDWAPPAFISPGRRRPAGPPRSAAAAQGAVGNQRQG